ncbi:MAG TPA: peptidoglycan recognition family protein [Methylocella sp.]|nr:peptidoglycan recognition family protein [Methylocella sp.]
MAGKIWLDEIPGKLIKLPVVHTPEVLLQLKKPILGAVLHTTNPKGSRLLTLQESRNDFAGSQEPLFRSAHFMVDRSGLIAQFRSLDQGSAHIGPPWMPNYVGIEHTAFHKDPLVDPEQINASADLLNMLKSELGLTLSELSKAGFTGVGRHNQFNSTECGEGPFFDRGDFGPDFKKILERALQRSPVGKWEVHVGDWTWIYTFKAGGTSRPGRLSGGRLMSSYHRI